MEQGIIAEGLVKTYRLKENQGFLKPKKQRSVEAVKGVSLEIPRGKIIGLLGVNGAGKTTMIRMLAAVVSPTAGSLTIDGIDAVRQPFQVKGKLNMITGGERNLYWRLTARENLAYFGSLYGLRGAALRQRTEELLAMTGLTDAANTPVERYSKGMKQRLQIARGLINDPAYLFLDEPTLGLDVLIAQEMRGYVAALAREQDKGVLLTTHYISEAEELCDYIYVIDSGRVISQGTKEELKSLLRFRQELAVSCTTLRAESRQAIEQAFAAGPARVGFGKDGQERPTVLLTGEGAAWSRLLALLAELGETVLDIQNKEPDLEQVLVSIIRDFRAH